MRTLYVMCGLSFSGKSTLAREVARATGAELVSLDDLNAERGLYGGDGIPVEEWERTSQLANERLRALAPSGRDVVLDDTSCYRWLRDRWRERAASVGYAARLVWVDVPPETILRRREQSERSADRRGIRDSVFAAHAESFERPQEDEAAARYDGAVPAREWVERYVTGR